MYGCLFMCGPGIHENHPKMEILATTIFNRSASHLMHDSTFDISSRDENSKGN